MHQTTNRPSIKWLPSRKWLFLPPLLIGVGVVAWLTSTKKELPRVEASRMQAVHVNVLQMKSREVFAEATGYGTAQAFRTWTATAEVGGRIQETHSRLRDGIVVEKGDLLIGVDPRDYEIKLERSRAELAQAQAQLEQIRLQAKADEESLAIQKQLLEVRKSEVSRIEKLRGGIASSAAELDSSKVAWLQQAQAVQNLESSLVSYDAQIASAQASLAVADAGLKSAERDVDRTLISAPFDGILTSVSLEESQYVAPNQQLFQVIDTSTVEVEAQFSLTQLRQLLERPTSSSSRANESEQRRKGFVSASTRSHIENRQFTVVDDWLSRFTATVSVRSGSTEFSFPALVQRTTGTVNEQTRTLGIVVRVENNNINNPFSLSPGTYCEVKLQTAQPTLAHVVPRNSLDSKSVLIVDNANVLRRRSVQVAFAKEELAVVSDGLLDGDLVVINPSASLRAGALVQTHLAEEPNSWHQVKDQSACQPLASTALADSDTAAKDGTHD